MQLQIKKSGRFTYLYATKGYRNEAGKCTTKVVRKFGTVEELSKIHDDPIGWARAEVAEMTRLDKEEKESVSVSFKPSLFLSKDERRSYNGGYLFLQKVYYELGLDKICKKIEKKYRNRYDLNEILSNLLYTRILYPGSKMSSLEDAQQFLDQPGCDLHQVYRALSLLSRESDDIQAMLYKNSQKLGRRNTKVLYYDCTNYYFESEEEKGLRQYGHSKEHRPNPIVQMGLFMDMDGIPLAFSINPGNTSEQTTLIPLEQKLNDKFDISRLVVCTDCGLSSYENRKNNNVGERAFITVQSLKKLKSHIQEWALDPSGWHVAGSDEEYNLNEVDASKHHETTFHKERWINENGLSQRLIVTFSFKYMGYLRYVRSRQVERAGKIIERGGVKLNKKSQNDPGRFISATSYTDDGEVAPNTSYSLDEEMISQEERFDGFYALCTSLEDPAPDVLKANSYRWRIEDCFRIMKTDFDARPVYLQRDDRIQAHFLTCFLALILYKYLEKKINRGGNHFTVGEIIDTLAEMNFLSIPEMGYIPTYTRTDLTNALHGSAGFRTDKQIISKKTMRSIISKTKNNKESQ